jgi:hypothetical protein
MNYIQNKIKALLKIVLNLWIAELVGVIEIISWEQIQSILSLFYLPPEVDWFGLNIFLNLCVVIIPVVIALIEYKSKKDDIKKNLLILRRGY